MALTNTRARYGRIARWLHWGVAALVLGSYITMYGHKWFTAKGTFWHGELVQLHFSIGLSVLCLMALRLVWRWLNPRPSLAGVAFAQRHVARASHALLYLLLFLMPVTGYLSTGADTHWFNLFDITQFKHTSLFQSLGVDADALKPLKTIHEFIGAWVLWVLIALHATAGFYHHYGLRDDVLRRMTVGD